MTSQSLPRFVRTFTTAVTMSALLATAGSLPVSTQEPQSGKDSEWNENRELFVTMRDGIHLATDVLLPKGTTGKVPAILMRTPYGKFTEEVWVRAFAEGYLNHGFALVLQDERGQSFSEGEYKHYLQGANTDGYDTVDWIAKQPWSNGKVGTLGCSSSGETGWLTSAGNHPAHLAAIPSNSWAVGDIPGNYTRGVFYRGGVPLIGFWAPWYSDDVTGERVVLPPNTTQEERIRLHKSFSVKKKPAFPGDWTAGISLAELMYLPSKDILRVLGGAETPFDKYMTWTPTDPRWNDSELINAKMHPRVPTLHVSNWHDPAALETTRYFKHLQDAGTANQFLIVTAGPHCSIWGSSNETKADLKPEDLKTLAKTAPDTRVSDLPAARLDFGDLKFGDLEVGDARYRGEDHGYAKLFRNWYEYWLRGDENHVTDMPKVQLFVPGKGWVTDDHWPLKSTQFTKYFLTENTGSGSLQGAGMLSIDGSKEDLKDSFDYDPGNPTPSIGGGCCGTAVALDQRPAEARKDVLVYSTPPLEKPVTVAGPVEVVLYVSSSAKDTDFIVKLTDVYPDGKSVNLTEDAFRVRYREGFDKKVLMEPGGVYKITLDEMVTANRFQKGHQIRIDISSSSFPLYERNLNTGGNNYDETKWVVARNSVHHGGQHPSHVLLPVLPD